ncbi:MAG: hypothetical protein AABY22_31300, partial [Nanoarchaeota archaeon]
KEFYPTREQIEKSLTDSIDFPEKSIEIPTNRFDSEALPVWAFGGEKEAKAYGEFLREEAGIKEMPVYTVNKDYVDKQSQSFARQMWFRSLDFRSELNGFSRLSGGDNGLRGVKEIGGN